MRKIFTCLLAIVCTCAYGQTGTLDLAFGSNGKVITAVTAFDNYAYEIAIQPDGKIVAVGAAYTSSSGGSSIALVRYNTNGTLDNTFGTGGKVTTAIGSDAEALCVAVQTDGKIIVAGDAKTGSTYDFALARYNADGTLDNSFGIAGKMTTDFGSYEFVYRIALQADGKIVLAGLTGNYPNDNFALARYNTNGTLDNTFGTAGKVVVDFGSSEEAFALAIQADGKIIAAGYTGTSNDNYALARFNTSGNLDNTFGTGGKVTTDLGTAEDNITALAIQSDGKIVVAGYSGTGGINNQYDISLARYNSNGALDLTFGTAGKTITDFGTAHDLAVAMILQPDGKILIGAESGSSDSHDFSAARYTTAGALDQSFGFSGKAFVDYGGDDLEYYMAADGSRIYLVGETNINGNSNFTVAALVNDATTLPLSLSSFTGIRQNSSVQLNWNMFNEQNIRYFDIERSRDGLTFTTIGSVVSSASSLAKHVFTDPQPLKNLNYYRLKNVDLNGNFTYSATIVIKMTPNSTIEIYPNPAKNFINVRFNSKGDNLMIVDAAGKVVKTFEIGQTGNITTSLDISSLPKGSYYIRLENEIVAFVKQ